MGFRPSDGRTGFRPPCVARRGPGLLPFDAAEGPPSGCSFARCPPRCIAAAPHGCPGGFLRAELDSLIASAGDDKLVVIDYSTTWCGPCKVVAPKFEEMSTKYTDAIFAKCVGDSSPDATKLMKREGIRSVPAFHFWKKGAKVEVIAGANVQAVENGIKNNL